MHMVEEPTFNIPCPAFTKTGKVSASKRGVKVHACFCGKTFSRAEHLRRHQVCHDDSFQLICPHPGCGRPFYRDDLFKKHQKRHNEPNNRLSSMSTIPGYSIVPIRIAKPAKKSKEPPTPPDSVRSSTDSDASQDGDHDANASIAASEEFHTFKQELEEYSSSLEIDAFGDDTENQNYKDSLIIFQELGALKPRTALHILDVQRCVGWNVDPFTKMPKFRDHRVNTTEIYHHCLTVLGRVGKSPEWVEKIVEDRLGFLSSLAIASAHLDMLREVESESAVTLAVKYEVLQMLRDSTTAGNKKTSDLTFMAITQFLSCEALYGERDVLLTHIRGLECIANLRGGIRNLGWNDELALISGGKMMILSVAHDFECPPMFLNYDYQVNPHFPNLCQKTPESPVYWQNEDLAHLQGAKHCCQGIMDIMQDMRLLTEGFLKAFSDRQDSNRATWRAKIAFKDQAAAINARLANRPSQPGDAYYEIVRLTSMIYATALEHCVPFATAAKMTAPDAIENIADLLLQTDIVTCWHGDLSGVLFWCTLIASGASRPLTTNAGRRAGRWLRIGAMYNMILLSTEHYDVFLENARCVIKLQKILRAGDATSCGE